MKRFIKFLTIFILLICTTSNLFAEDKKEEAETEIPQGILDFRRFEIITLGSMPFVTLDVSLGYSFYKFFDNRVIKHDNSYAFPNPFKSGEDYKTEEMKGIIIASAVICLGIGLQDLITNIVKRNRILQATKNTINISEIENDPDAQKIELHSKKETEEEVIDVFMEEQ